MTELSLSIISPQVENFNNKHLQCEIPQQSYPQPSLKVSILVDGLPQNYRQAVLCISYSGMPSQAIDTIYHCVSHMPP